jgi:hypothetical protein
MKCQFIRPCRTQSLILAPQAGEMTLCKKGKKKSNSICYWGN